jgi:hypothetical protein
MPVDDTGPRWIPTTSPTFPRPIFQAPGGQTSAACRALSREIVE